MKHLNDLIKMTKQLQAEARTLDIEDGCNLRMIGAEDGFIHFNIENWNTYKGSLRLSDGRIIGEGSLMDGKGMTLKALYKQQNEEQQAFANRRALSKQASETNSVICNDTLVPVVGCDANKFTGHESTFKIYRDDGSFSRWYGHDAKDALRNAMPFIRCTPVKIELEAATKQA